MEIIQFQFIANGNPALFFPESMCKPPFLKTLNMVSFSRAALQIMKALLLLKDQFTKFQRGFFDYWWKCFNFIFLHNDPIYGMGSSASTKTKSNKIIILVSNAINSICLITQILRKWKCELGTKKSLTTRTKGIHNCNSLLTSISPQP